MGEILVQLVELLQAAAEMNQAMELYHQAVDAAKTAAAELASKWAGDSRDAFVAHQEDAYNWHMSIIGVVNEMISLIRKAADLYDEVDRTVKGIVQG